MILVTGGTGLVGSHLLLRLTEEDQKIKATYRSKEKIKRVENIFAFAKAHSRFSKITWVQADITNIPKLTESFKDITHVYHCAALISFDPFDFEKLIKINVEGTANIVNLSLSNSIVKLCYVSSIATLAQLPNNPINEDNHWDPNEDNSVYAISKYGAETEVWRGSQEGLDILIFNPGVILGEGPLDEGSGLFFKRVIEGSSYYPAGGTAFIDVKDLVILMIKGMKGNLKNERFIAVAGNHSFKTIFDSIATAMELKTPKRVLSNNLLNLLVMLDRSISLFTRKRKITKNMINSVQTTKHYSNKKLLSTLSHLPIPIEDTLKRVSRFHKESS